MRCLVNYMHLQTKEQMYFSIQSWNSSLIIALSQRKTFICLPSCMHKLLPWVLFFFCFTQDTSSQLRSKSRRTRKRQFFWVQMWTNRTGAVSGWSIRSQAAPPCRCRSAQTERASIRCSGRPKARLKVGSSPALTYRTPPKHSGWELFIESGFADLCHVIMWLQWQVCSTSVDCHWRQTRRRRRQQCVYLWDQDLWQILYRLVLF